MHNATRSGAVLALVATACGVGCSNSNSTPGATPVTAQQAVFVSDVNATANFALWSAVAPSLVAVAVTDAGARAASTDAGIGPNAVAADAGDAAASDGATEDASTNAATALAAALAAARANVYYLPAGCAGATASGSVVTYVLNNCTLPVAATTVSGTITVAFTTQASATGALGNLILQAQATNLMAGQASVTFNRQALFTVSGTTGLLQTVADSFTSSGPTGDLASAASTTGTSTSGATVLDSLTWTAGALCTLDNATYQITLNNGAYTETFSNVSRCVNECPQSGTVSLTNGSGTNIVFSYNGTSSLQVSGVSGSSSATLVCGG